MKRLMATAVVVLLSVVVVSTCQALDPQKTITQYGHNIWYRQNGLPANAVNVVLQTRDGYLWLGTSAGLFRFDGARFERVSTDPEDLKNRETISALCEGRDGSLWVGTANNQLCRLKDGKILRYSDADGVMSRNVITVFESKGGRFWLGTSFGLYEFKDGKFVSTEIDPKYITAIAEDARGRLWVGTHGGVRIFQGGKEIKSSEMLRGLQKELITTLYADRRGAVWVGTYRCLFRWE